jgi:hypothetical protein
MKQFTKQRLKSGVGLVAGNRLLSAPHPWVMFIDNEKGEAQIVHEKDLAHMIHPSQKGKPQ